MSETEDIELVHGSGNVYRDFGYAEADSLQLRAQLAAEIIGIIRRRKLTQAVAAKLSGLTQADVSHIKNAKLKGFTIDRLVTVLGKFDREVKMEVVPVRRKKVLEPA